jgi:CDP-6-deoxy-D-xylo-4-hexulose-3-dehydrase
MVNYLEEHGIHIRLFFAGNILKHRAYKNTQYIQGNRYGFATADYLMENACFCGCWPGLNKTDMCYIADILDDFFNGIK